MKAHSLDRSRLAIIGLIVLVVAVAAGGVVVWATRKSPIFIGAVYPTNGGQGPGGIEEYRGVELASILANSEGGVHGRRIALHLKETDSADEAPGSVDFLAAEGAPVIMGSYGSTISLPAAQAAYNRGRDFWETGAVGELGMLSTAVPPPYLGTRVFRFPPAGTVLGTSAIDFVNNELAPQVASKGPLRFAVAYVKDAYGSEVAAGALKEIARLNLPLVGTFPYDLNSVNYGDLASQIKASDANVLFVASYLTDAVSLRQQILAQHVPLLVNIGTSSSYCLPEFGADLGSQAVGLFASDKPSGDVLKTSNLAPGAASALIWARKQYAARWGGSMGAAALTGFAGGWGLFHFVLPAAKSMTPGAIAAAARQMNLPMGALPNGSGLEFGPPGSQSAGENLRALSVIWEWIAPNTRAVIWPRSYATSPIKDLLASSAS